MSQTDNYDTTDHLRDLMEEPQDMVGVLLQKGNGRRHRCVQVRLRHEKPTVYVFERADISTLSTAHATQPELLEHVEENPTLEVVETPALPDRCESCGATEGEPHTYPHKGEVELYDTDNGTLCGRCSGNV